MATDDFTEVDLSEFEYNELIWGDLIYGSKEQLQALGLAVDLAFPGEPGAPRRRMKVLDPRGLSTTIGLATYKGTGIYSASISFPGRSWWDQEERWNDFAEGVKKREYPSFDDYRGTADALVAAGLVRLDQLPGKPGMRKVKVTILADGTLPKGAPTANCSRAQEPGARLIERRSKTTYGLCVYVCDDEESRRREAEDQAKEEWEQRILALPRPAPLRFIKAITSELAVRERRATMRLIWSRPSVANEWVLPLQT